MRDQPAHMEKAHRNNRRSYQFMASEVVSWEFKTLPAAARCAHCTDAALVIRNRQRKAKGLPPYWQRLRGALDSFSESEYYLIIKKWLKDPRTAETARNYIARNVGVAA